MSHRDQPAADEALLRLERALQWRAGGHLPRRSLAASALCHAGVAAVLFAVAPTAGGHATAWPYHTAVAVFAPAPSSASPDSTPLPSPAPAPPESPPEAARDTLPEPEVDLGAIKVSFANDVAGQLPAVLRDQHGMLALLDRDDLTVTQYVFRPPAWEMQDAAMDVSSNFRILMDPPEKWVLWREIAARYGITLERYRAYAVFNILYRHCVINAIREQARARGPRSGGRVSAVRLAFMADRPCGIKVLEVSLANQSVPQPL